jgi:hypothetical protein
MDRPKGAVHRIRFPNSLSRAGRYPTTGLCRLGTCVVPEKSLATSAEFSVCFGGVLGSCSQRVPWPPTSKLLDTAQYL